MGLSGEAVMVSCSTVSRLSLVHSAPDLTDTATGCGVVVVHLRIRTGRTAIGSPDLAPAAKAHHRLGYLSGLLCAYLPGVDNM